MCLRRTPVLELSQQKVLARFPTAVPVLARRQFLRAPAPQLAEAPEAVAEQRQAQERQKEIPLRKRFGSRKPPALAHQKHRQMDPQTLQPGRSSPNLEQALSLLEDFQMDCR